jgi:hypothetical protein
MISYEEILDQAKGLPSEERLRLADALLEEELGFGMWRDREEMANVEAFVEEIRDLDSGARDGYLKNAEEFLQ